jgi:hypothetical protein
MTLPKRAGTPCWRGLAGLTLEKTACYSSVVPSLRVVSTLYPFSQDAEKVRQRRSCRAQRLNVPKRTPRLFARCGLAWDKARIGAPGLGG